MRKLSEQLSPTVTKKHNLRREPLVAEKFQVGFVGSGGMAAAHVKAMKPFEDVAFAAFCDVRLEAAQKMASEHGGKAFSKPDDMFENAKLDAVFLLLPPFAHGEPELLALKHK